MQPVGGEHSFYAYKVKAHTSQEQERHGYITTSRLREHNGLADKAAQEAVLQHPIMLRQFIDVQAKRGRLYIRFLQELAKLFVSIAKAVEEAYDKTVGGEATPPASIFGKRRMARVEPVTLALRAPAGGEGQALQLAYGPLPFSSWQGHESFIANLRGFWAALTFRPRARGVQGTTWVELWIAYEMTYGGCPRRPKHEGAVGPWILGPRPGCCSPTSRPPPGGFSGQALSSTPLSLEGRPPED